METFLNKNEIIINKIMPCFAMPDKIRFISLVNKDISAVFPYINAIIDNAIYNKEGHTIMFKREYKQLTLFANKITGSKIDDENDAEKILDWLVNLINDCWVRRNEIKPNFERRHQLNMLDILKLLPNKNCKKCGNPTCLALAAKIVQEEETVEKCVKLFEPEFSEKRKILNELLLSAGYKVSNLF
ncbi:MAG TPA: (Fe-S)-binding protein [bacterium]|nr:(Fe-S)-binding protein [bacterium]HOL48256.1 (Fe-S)-binding protein [bacterium]HPQ18430.1 (Fe-S)-binding protein [bacterium]